jgi:acyl-CoA synthetase (NDP forming)/RimJ/RimL family protein N-acetyltransferase
VTASRPTTASPPAHWSVDVVLADGGTVHLRPIRPDDAEALQAMHARLSEQTRYFRFFGPYPTIPPRDVERFTVVDYERRLAIVAVLGGRIIGVARYEGLESSTAEVAFVIEDAHQGRGLGPLLLEHLAAAARERGLTRFDADVLPTNRRMLRVFLAAGYAAERHFDSGTVHVTFAIEPTAQSLAASRVREQHAEARSVRRLLSPTSLAVVGASAERRNVGRAVLEHVVTGGFTGRAVAVHPRASTVGDVPAYKSVTDVPGDVDVVVVAVPAPAVLDVVRDCAAKGVHGVVVLSAGFADTGKPDDARQQDELVRIARANGMRVVGPNCLGLVNTDPGVSLNASIAPVVPAQGRLGMFSQSGTLGNVILADAAARGIGLSTFVSAGNRADVSGNDLLQFWEEDESTEVVLLYLESFGNPRKFTRLARRLSVHKPVVVVRAGHFSAPTPADRSPAAVRMPPEGEAALLTQAGVVQVDSIAAGLDVATMLARQPLPAGRRVAVVGNSSAIGMLTVAALDRAGLTASSGVVDLGSTAEGDAYAAAVTRAVSGGQVDAVVVIHAPALGGAEADVAAAIGSAAAGCGKPVVAIAPGPFGPSEAPQAVPSYRGPEVAVAALAKAVTLAEWRSRPVGALPDLADVDTERARALVTGSPATGASDVVVLDEEATNGILDAVGIAVSTAVRAGSAQAALVAARRIGWPVAVKAADANLRRRTDLGAVRLDISSPRALRAAYDAVAEVAGSDVLVQRMAPSGVAVTIDAFEEPSLGAVVSVAVGGIASELLGDRAFRAVPLTDVDAAEMVRSLRASPLLLGWRGAEPVDVAALEDLLLRVSVLADEVPELLAVRLGSVLVGRGGVTVLEAEASAGPPPARPDSGPRHLT